MKWYWAVRQTCPTAHISRILIGWRSTHTSTATMIFIVSWSVNHSGSETGRLDNPVQLPTSFFFQINFFWIHQCVFRFVFICKAESNSWAEKLLQDFRPRHVTRQVHANWLFCNFYTRSIVKVDKKETNTYNVVTSFVLFVELPVFLVFFKGGTFQESRIFNCPNS